MFYIIISESDSKQFQKHEEELIENIEKEHHRNRDKAEADPKNNIEKWESEVLVLQKDHEEMENNLNNKDKEIEKLNKVIKEKEYKIK